ncbi:pyridoxamine 5-phosphate oxidase [Kosmotoga sp. DU53]|nr:pyridoxamine 5-phosphate oxidase [Kosmotoga sp. DU53]
MEGFKVNYSYPLSDDTWGREEIEAILNVILSKNFTMGKTVKEFENIFADWIGSKYAIMVNSGSSANLLAIAALVYSGRLERGDEIIVPAVSWSTTYFPLHQYGLRLKFVDIDKETLNIDPTVVENAITKDTKAIFAVNLLGNPCDYNKLQKICKDHNLLLLEDNCEALGAVYNGKYTGTFGLIGTFSMFYSHHICTMEGGVAVTDDEELYHYMLAIRAHGWSRDLPENSRIYKKSKSSFYERFNFIVPGYNLRPLEMEAAIGIQQMKKIDRIISQRRLNAEYFLSRIGKMPLFRTQKETGKSSWFGFPIILSENASLKREELIKILENGGVETRPIVAGNFVRNPVMKYINHTIHGNLPSADYIHFNGLFVGNHSKDIKDKIDLLFSLLHSFAITHR